MVEEHYNNWIVDHYKKEQNRHRPSWRNQYLKAKHQNTQTTIKIGCLFRLHYAFLDRERVIIFQQQHLKWGPVLRKTKWNFRLCGPQFFFEENKAIKSIKKKNFFIEISEPALSKVWLYVKFSVIQQDTTGANATKNVFATGWVNLLCFNGSICQLQ